MGLPEKLKNLLKGDHLQARMARGSMWLTIGSAGEQGLRFLRNILLTRILAPQAFGIMAIVLAIDAICESFTELGIKEAIVQNPSGEERKYLNGAWWLAVVRAIALYATVAVAAPWAGQFYNNPDLVPLMRVAFLSILFRGMMSANAYVAVKQLKFKRWVILYHGGAVCGLITAIVLAFMIPDVWALVIGFTVEAFARCLFSYLACPFKPGLTFGKESLKALFAYSRGMFGLPILTFLFMRADVFVIGKLCPLADLGLYSMAASLARMPSQFVASITGQIMMPALSQIQTEKEKMNRVIMRFTRIIVFLGFPLLMFAVLYGSEILTFAYGRPYGAAGIPFAIIFVSELLRISSTPLAAFYLATGRPSLHRLFTIVRAGVLLILIIPLVKWFGLTGAALAGLIGMIVGYAFQAYRMVTINGLDLSGYSRVFLKASLSSVCVFATWLLGYNFLDGRPLLEILVGIGGCLLAYGLAAYMLLRIEPKQGQNLRMV